MLKLIASENFSSLAVQLSMGNLLTDKYAEGFPHHRFYAGCDNVDEIEDLACTEAKKLFNSDYNLKLTNSFKNALGIVKQSKIKCILTGFNLNEEINGIKFLHKTITIIHSSACSS